jgi:hypothetical protein
VLEDVGQSYWMGSTGYGAWKLANAGSRKECRWVALGDLPGPRSRLVATAPRVVSLEEHSSGNCQLQKEEGKAGRVWLVAGRSHGIGRKAEPGPGDPCTQSGP